MRKRVFVSALCAAGVALALAHRGGSLSAQQPPCDSMTGGGVIVTTASGTHPADKANLAIGGGCKSGQPTWGHLQYQDKGNNLKAQGTSITAYNFEGPTGSDPQTGQPTGTRIICGTASTNLYGNVNFRVRARDRGEPGTTDEFDIRLTQGAAIVYTTEVGGPTRLNNGNIQLHKPNPSTNGSFGGSCPADLTGGSFTLSLTKSGSAWSSSTVTSAPPGISCGTSCTSQSASFSGVVTLTATGPSDQAIGITWSGDCDSTTPVSPGPPSTSTCTVTMTANKSVDANLSFIE